MSNYLIHMITNIKQENRRGAQRGAVLGGDTDTQRNPGAGERLLALVFLCDTVEIFISNRSSLKLGMCKRKGRFGILV